MIALKTAEFKVGALILTVIALVAVMSMQVSEDPSYLGSSKTIWFQLNDANGLLKNSAVKMAGINVGVIKDIKLRNGKAYIELNLGGDIPVNAKTEVRLRDNGILGDKYIELVTGDPGAPSLETGSQILRVEEAGSISDLMNSIGKITGSLQVVADSLEKASTGEGDRSTPLGRIVDNIENFTKDLSEISTANREKLNESIDSATKILSTLDELVNDESEDGFRVAWYRATRAINRVDSSMQNIEEITDKVNNGEGTIGRLINDDETVKELNSAIRNVNQFIGVSSVMQTTVDFHTNYLSEQAATRNTLSILVQPGLDRYYQFGLVDDPNGVTEVTETTEVPGGSVEKTETFKNEFKFTALYAKKFYNLTLKGGIIENSGGIALDYSLFSDNLRFSVEAFDFQDAANIRSHVRWIPTKGIYVMGGGENIGNSAADAYLGAGIYLTNDDLRLFLAGLSF
ncbi:MAG: MlaD family protein [Bdellovibrionales bacterium]